MTTPSSALSREEMLANWIAEKRKKKEQQLTSAPKSILSTTETKGSTRPTTLIRRQSSASESTSFYSASSTSFTARNVTSSTKNGRPPRSSMKSVSTPPHLQRARNLLQERNYNQRSILQSKNKTPAASDASSRKRSISQRSPQMTMPSPTNPFPTPTTMPDTISNKDPFQGLVIAVSSTPTSQFNMSPLSMAGLIQSPTERLSNDSVAQGKVENDEKEHSQKVQQITTPKEHSSLPATSISQLLSCTSRSVNDKDDRGEETPATTDQTPRHVMFAFEEDSVPSEKPRRRRRGSFLLLPTPSPFDPSCTLPSVEEDPSDQQSPPKSTASKWRSPSNKTNDHKDEQKKESESTISESSRQLLYLSHLQQSQLQPSTPSLGEATFTFQISPTSAFSKVTSTHKAHDQEENEIFGKENTVLGNQMTAQQRRRRLDHVLSPRPQSLLELSSPSSQRSTFQLQPSPTSAFFKVPRSRNVHVEIFPSRLDADLSNTIPDPACGDSKLENLERTAQPIAPMRAIIEELSSTEVQGGGLHLGDTVKMGSKTALESIDEVADTFEGATLSVHEREYAALLNKFTEMMVEKQDLQTRLANIRKSYEQRVTPFRDVFDEKRKLQLENEQLKQINSKIDAQNHLLRQQKEDVDAMVAQLQQQMMATLQAAVQNSSRLKQELDIANATIQKLENELSIHQQAVEASVDDSIDV